MAHISEPEFCVMCLTSYMEIEMPTTAYSKKFQRELDTEQLLGLLGYDMSSDPDLAALPAFLREEISRDLICPECGVSGCVIVARAKSKMANIALRQPHFRFRALEGVSAHHPLCDHYEDSEVKNNGDQLVAFGQQDRSAETRIVRELVARGIEQQIFSQETIRNMRQWFFETKIRHQFVMDVSEDAVQWAAKLRRLYPHGVPFKPMHAELPGFDWQSAAVLQFISENSSIFNTLHSCRYYHTKTALQRASRIIKKYHGKGVFDVTVLKPEYEKTIQFACFTARNLGMYGKDVDRKEQEALLGLIPTFLLAFAALLLYVSNWDIDAAINKLIVIVKAPQPADMNVGNVIGLNPFHDFTAFSNIMQTREIASRSNNGFDYNSQLDGIIKSLKRQYSEWKLGTPGATPTCG